MTIKELEQIEDRARRGQPIDSELILTLTAYLREVLQAKANAEAVAYEALKKGGPEVPLLYGREARRALAARLESSTKPRKTR